MAANNSFSKLDGAPFAVKYPQEWANRDRMNYLLAPFPSSVETLAQNNSKFLFWSSFILSSSGELHTPIISEADLQERFKWNGHTTPRCLDKVLVEMERVGQVVKVDEYCSEYCRQDSWISWGVGMLKKPLSWAVGSYISGSNKYTGGYVVKKMAEDLAATVLADHQKSLVYTSTDGVMTFAAFEALCLRSSSREFVPVLVRQLAASGHLARGCGMGDRGYDVVKLSCSKDKSLTISDVDIGIVRLKDTQEMLSKQVATLEEAISQSKDSARKKHKDRDKPGALRFLRQGAAKKQVLQRKVAMLDNVQTIVHNIQNAETDALVFAAYKSGVDALRSVQKSQSLGQAQDLMDDLKEMTEEEEEISATLSEDLTGDADEDELMRELEDIVAASDETGLESALLGLSVNDKESLASIAAALPPVPAHSPGKGTLGQPSVASTSQAKTCAHDRAAVPS